MIALSGLEPKQHLVTAEGAEELRRVLEDLRRMRLKVAEEARVIASQTGSNSALDESVQAVNHARASELNDQIVLVKHILATIKIIARPATNRTVQLGSRVVLDLGGVRHAYSIVGSLEVDPARGKISNESPLGLSLIGKKVNERVEMIVRGRRIRALIAGIG